MGLDPENLADEFSLFSFLDKNFSMTSVSGQIGDRPTGKAAQVATTTATQNLPPRGHTPRLSRLGRLEYGSLSGLDNAGMAA
jgi:hypothetical protein